MVDSTMMRMFSYQVFILAGGLLLLTSAFILDHGNYVMKKKTGVGLVLANQLTPDLSPQQVIENINTARDTSSFRLIIFPDTQIYSKDSPLWRRSSSIDVFNAMTRWVKQRVSADNIKAVLHMGDIVNDNNELYQWENASAALGNLDDTVPYILAVGNHDMLPGNPGWIPDRSRNTKNFNRFFPVSRFESKNWYGGSMTDPAKEPGSYYNNSYHFINAGRLQFIIISLEVAPTDAMLKWADSILIRHHSKRAIIITHSYMLADDRRDYPGGFGYLPDNGNTGDEIWHKLVKKHANVFLVLSGHVTNTDAHRGLLRSKGIQGNDVYQLLSGEGHDGWLRILQFVPSENKIQVQSYSPWHPRDAHEQYLQYPFSLPGYNTDSTHQYKLFYTMTDN